MNAESLIFDIDGTLWNSTDLVAEGYNLHFQELGLERRVTGEDLKKLFGRTMDAIADIMLSDIPAPRRYEIMLGCMAREHDVLEADPCRIAYPGVVETLEKLARNHRLFLASNCQKGYPELLMQKLGVAHLFTGHICFGDTGLSKGESVKILMQRHDITNAVYIGDTQGDLEASRTAGIPFVRCAYGFGAPEDWDASIDRFPQLLELFP